MENSIDSIYERLVQELDAKQLGNHTVKTLAMYISILNHNEENLESQFNILDIFNQTLIESGLAVPLIARDRVLELTKARIKHTKETNIRAQSKRYKKNQIKDMLLSYMLSLVAVGETVERASELVAGYCKETYDGEYQKKASSLEKQFPKYAHAKGKSGKTRLEATKKLFDLYDAGVFPKREREIHNPDFWREVRKKNEGFKLPTELKGSRRE